MHDRTATVGERFMAWVIAKSWGNFSLDCRQAAEGDYVFQQDCANELGLEKRAISKAASYYERRGYLVRHGIAKILRPVVRPDLTAVADDKSPEWATFVAEWKVAHSTEWQELEVARSTVESFRKVLRSDYKQWCALRTKSGAYKEKSLESSESAPSSRGQTLQPQETTDDHDDDAPNKPKAKPAVESAAALPGPPRPDVGAMLAAVGIVLDDRQVQQVVGDLGSVPADYYVAQITERRKELLAEGKPFLPGLAVKMAPSAAQIWQREQAAGGPVPSPGLPVDARTARMRRTANAVQRMRGEPEVDYDPR